MGSDSEPNAFKFFPAAITVPVGTTVRWQNKSDIPHDATAVNKSFGSEQLSKGDTFEFTFTTPGDFEYFCSVSGHRDAGMEAVVKVTGSAATPTPAPSSSTTTAAGGTTGTTAGGGSTTTTTTAKAAAGGSTTTTTAGGGVTSTTQAPSVTPTSAPDTGGVTTTTTGAATGGGEEAAADGDGGPKSPGDKSSPIGIAFVSASTLMLLGISGKLLASKS